MPTFQVIPQTTGYDIDELKTCLEILAIEVASTSEINIPTIPPTAAVQKSVRATRFEEGAARLHDICVQHNEFNKLYDNKVVIQVSPETLEFVEQIVIAGAQHSVKQGKGAVGTGPLPMSSTMAMKEAKHMLIRAATDYYNICLVEATKARREVDAADAIKDKDNDSEATTSIEGSENLASEDKSEVDDDVFKGKVDAVYELPLKKLWNNLKVNHFLLEKDNKLGKQGSYTSHGESGISGLKVTFDKWTIRPIITVYLDGHESVDCLASLSRDDNMRVYLTWPAIPVLLRLTIDQKSSIFPDIHKVKVEALM